MHYLSRLRPILTLHHCDVSWTKRGNEYDYLERKDRKIFRKLINSTGHPLLPIITRVKPSSHQLRKVTCYEPNINTTRFKKVFFNA